MIDSWTLIVIELGRCIGVRTPHQLYQPINTLQTVAPNDARWQTNNTSLETLLDNKSDAFIVLVLFMLHVDFQQRQQLLLTAKTTGDPPKPFNHDPTTTDSPQQDWCVRVLTPTGSS